MMTLILFLAVLTASAAVTYVTYDLLQQKENKVLYFSAPENKIPGVQQLGAYISRNRVLTLFYSVALVLLLLGHYLFALMVILGVLLRFQRQQSRRRREMIENLPSAIAIMTRSMRAGQTIEKSMNSVLEFTSSKEISLFFKRVLRMVYVSGKPTHEVLMEEAKKNRFNEIAMLASILETHAEIGGNVIDVLSIFEEQMRRTMVTQKKIISLMTEGRTSIIILAVIPLLVLGAVFNFTPEYLTFFLREEGRTGLMLIALFYLFGIGSSIAFVKGR